MKRLSIIIPMFNVEPFVERCLRSLENQDIPIEDYEIICINDGSPDNCRGVVMRLQKEFNNIILIDQENQGVSNARNNGIDYANGRYLMFIDPDDYVDANCFARILKNAEVKDVQVSFLGYTILNENGTIRKTVFNISETKQIYKGTEAYLKVRGDFLTDPDRMVGLLFEAQLFNNHNLRYLPGVPFLEDGEFIVRILCLAERCIFDGRSFYQRTNRPGSATNSNLFYSEKANSGFLHAACNLKRFQQIHHLNDIQKKFLNQPICKFVVLVIISTGNSFNLKKIRNIRKKLNESGLGKVVMDSVDIEYSKLGYFYNRSIYLLYIYNSLIYWIHHLRLRLNKINVS